MTSPVAVKPSDNNTEDKPKTNCPENHGLPRNKVAIVLGAVFPEPKSRPAMPGVVALVFCGPTCG
ncbi:MAG: hypothetical protein ABIR13_02060 [Polaromonas sp.]